MYFFFFSPPLYSGCSARILLPSLCRRSGPGFLCPFSSTLFFCGHHVRSFSFLTGLFFFWAGPTFTHHQNLRATPPSLTAAQIRFSIFFHFVPFSWGTCAGLIVPPSFSVFSGCTAIVDRSFTFPFFLKAEFPHHLLTPRFSSSKNFSRFLCISRRMLGFAVTAVLPPLVKLETFSVFSLLAPSFSSWIFPDPAHAVFPLPPLPLRNSGFFTFFGRLFLSERTPLLISFLT